MMTRAALVLAAALGSTAAFSLVVPHPCRGAITRSRPLLMKEEFQPEEERDYDEYRYSESRPKADFEGHEAGSYDYHFEEASPNEEVSGYRLGYGEPKRAKIDMDMLKKYGVAGTVAYILTELAFWAVAFPVAAALLYQTTGHWPDVFQDDADRVAVLGFVFAGANIARLAVPLRLGAAFALAPWVDDNVLRRFRQERQEVE